MKNYTGPVSPITVVSDGAHTSGVFVLLDGIYGVAGVTVATGENLPLHTEGVFTLPKTTSEAWTLGQRLFWNTSTGKFTIDSTKTPVNAVAAVAAGSADATGSVALGMAEGGLKFRSGIIALDGSNPTPVTTGLTICTNGGATINKTTAPGVGTVVVTADPGVTTGVLNLYAWKVTATNDATLIASTGTENVSWWASGY